MSPGSPAVGTGGRGVNVIVSPLAASPDYQRFYVKALKRCGG